MPLRTAGRSKRLSVSLWVALSANVALGTDRFRRRKASRAPADAKRTKVGTHFLLQIRLAAKAKMPSRASPSQGDRRRRPVHLGDRPPWIVSAGPIPPCLWSARSLLLA